MSVNFKQKIMPKFLIFGILAILASLISALFCMKKAKKDPFDEVMYAPPMDLDQQDFLDQQFAIREPKGFKENPLGEPKYPMTPTEAYQKVSEVAKDVLPSGTPSVIIVPVDSILIEEAHQNALKNPEGLYEAVKDDESIHAGSDFDIDKDIRAEIPIGEPQPCVLSELIIQPDPKEESPIIELDVPGIGGTQFTINLENQPLTQGLSEEEKEFMQDYKQEMEDSGDFIIDK